MNILHCKQGGDEWRQARLGIPTASRFGEIVTCKGKRSASWSKLYAQLLAEYIRGRPTEKIETQDMARGIELEDRARAMYELETGNNVEQVGGIFLDEEKTIMASPDGIMPEISTGLEIKCPRLETHIQYILEGVLPTQYRMQVLGNLWVSGFHTWDFVSFCPDYTPEPIFIIEIQPYDADLKFIEKMAKEITAFSRSLEAYKKRIDRAREVKSCPAEA